ncbi:anthranilate synthase component I family protein [Carboxydothermus ferrireducens]|uniref:Anthranilate synthase component 1 n=1 Tax=Carboxydothermus ferrireducens DSM 11255 TaxID=1119529 RepID=A0ABX2RB01_9THEO|nr:anthranilate synthase component I family protein [Carboxydothermus ferrireducens]NYE58353.1 anthranilate synthase component 1 [Carboxydothermus ferrireducens DSM 11255]
MSKVYSELDLTPNWEEYCAYAKHYQVVPVMVELLADTFTPITLYQHLALGKGISFLLESAPGNEKMARFSFIGYDPFKVLTGRNLEVVSSQLFNLKGPPIAGLPFYGGAVGYFSYGLVYELENLRSCRHARDDEELFRLMFPEKVLVFDHRYHTLKIVINTLPQKEGEKTAYRRAQDSIKEIIGKLTNLTTSENWALTIKPERSICNATMTKKDFCTMVEKAKDYIKAGDIFQVVLSQRFSFPCLEAPFNIYRRLRRLNPSPYMFFLDFGELKLIGASPEMLVRLEGGIVETRPIAGTRPRTGQPEEDLRLARELLADEKERAEHLMLVDLGRNDLGKVCRPGSVKVTEFFKVEEFSHVMHLVSTVQGEVEKKFNSVDVLKAVFPAGTVSGAPKIRAMEIIDELEPVPRGPYAGAVGYISFSGEMNTCITIRTLWIKDEMVYFQAGAGIVWDSDPEREYQETINKVQAMVEAVTGAAEFRCNGGVNK